MRPARELIFSLKYSYLNALTGKYHPRLGKNLYVEKNGLKLTKNRLFGYGILTTFRKSHFLTTNNENKITKYTLPKTTLKTGVVPCSLKFYNIYGRHEQLLNFRQKLHLFSDIYFCMDIMMGIVREDIFRENLSIKNVTFTKGDEMMKKQSLDFVTDF